MRRAATGTCTTSPRRLPRVLGLLRPPENALTRRTAAALAALTLAALGLTAPAGAHAAGIGHWKLEVRPAPTNLPLAHDGKPGQGVIVLTLANLGDAPIDGQAQQVTATDRLPAGLEVTSIAATDKSTPDGKTNTEGAGAFACAEPTPGTIRCTFGKALGSYQQLEVFLRVRVTAERTPQPPGEPVPLDQLEVQGGETAPATLTRALAMNGKATEFGVEQFEVATENEDGSADLQAGSHPYQMTTTFDLNDGLGEDDYSGTPKLQPSAPALQKNLSFKLPPGLIGDPNVGERCAAIDFTDQNGENTNTCPDGSIVGVATVTINDPILLEYTAVTVPVFDLVPSPGEPAQLGFTAEHVPVVLDTQLRAGGDYGVSVEVRNASSAVQLLSSRVTIWGTPGDPSHDAVRGWRCLGYPNGRACEGGRAREPFLTLPTACSSRPVASVSGESWPQTDGAVARILEGDPETVFHFPAPLRECSSLDFSPTLTVTPDTEQANSPAGMAIHLHLRQQATLEPGGRAEAALKTTTVTLPEGVLLSPSAATGLEACAEGETEAGGGVGFTGLAELNGEGEPAVQTATFTSQLPNPLQPGANFCPDGSKIGVVRITSPDLPVRTPGVTPTLQGGVYLTAQNANPFGSLFALYIVASEPESGVVVKLAGEVQVDPQTGRITTTFANTPQVPFEDMTLELFGGPRAPLTTPAACGSYETGASLVPWSAPSSGGAQAPPSVSSPSSFNITSGPGGSRCASPQPFSPSFDAGSADTRAGAFTPFEMTLGHADTDQAPTALTVRTPAGLVAMISHATLCPQPQAAAGTCGPASEIGQASATVGLGSEPFTQTGGRVYITGPYDGAPFGLSIVVPTKAGPFDFGDVVTRAAIDVDPNTAAVTISSTLPTMVDTAAYQTGVPVQLEQLHVVVNRPEFELNPTSCGPMNVEATLAGAQGATARASSPFQTTDCGGLPFAPKLTATALGNASKANGAAFKVTIQSPGVGQAGIRKVDLTLPKALPSRLSTIQKACPEAVFDANPASCDEGSVIGQGIVHTPLFANPLAGPAYLVSHGGAAFPDIEFVLQGEGIELVLDGQVDIKGGVTYSRFDTAPDAPFSTFESIFPAGPHSALTAHASAKDGFDLCGQHLRMPTEITAQNGAHISQSTPVALTGCSGVSAAKTKKLSRAQLLARALKACRARYRKQRAHGQRAAHKQRVACERRARKRYGTHRRAGKSGKKATRRA